MSQLMDTVMGSMGADGIRKVATQIGATPEQTQRALPQALSVLIGAVADKNTGSSGWNLISSFLDKNRDGSLLDDLLGMALGKGGSEQANAAVLSQILGGKQGAVVSGVSQTTGLDVAQVMKLLPLLAPMVTGALAKAQQSGSLNEQEVSDFLRKERGQAAAQAPASAGLLGSLFDADGDGNVMDDLTGFGSKMLGRLFEKH